MRYIKVDEQWIDTLKSKEYGIEFVIIDNTVIKVESNGDEHYIGYLQEEKEK